MSTTHPSPASRRRPVGRRAHVCDEVSLDPSQQAVVDRRAGSGPVVVVGGPGTGKTTTLIEAVAARVLRDGLEPGALLVLAPSRLAAADLRDRLTHRIGGAGRSALVEPPARTAASYAFALIRRQAVLTGQPTPRLISGPEQDAILADLLAGHASGDGAMPAWPAEVSEALTLRGFRHELRDLLMRAMERGIYPDELARLGRRHRWPIWSAAAVVYREYLQVSALASPGAYDPAAIVDHAAAMLADDATLLAAERSRVRLVAVDDHQESGEAVARLLDQLCPPGADLILTGDPDTTTQSFRGAQSRLLGEAGLRYRRRDGAPAPELVLGTCWRFGSELAVAGQRVVARIGALAPSPAARRDPVPQPIPTQPGQFDDVATGFGTAVVRSIGAQAALIAAELRRWHLMAATPWSEMAVVVRNAQQAAALCRGLLQAGVPVGMAATELALRDEPAVRPLLAITSVVLDESRLDDPEVVAGLLTSLGRADPLRLRRLRQALRRHEEQLHGERSVQELLRGCLLDPDELAGVPGQLAEPALRVGRVLAAGRSACAAPDASAEQVLWAIWQATGYVEEWRARALAGGPAGRRADRDLDVIVALFETAARFADRLPGAGALEFLLRLDGQDLPEDSVAAKAPVEAQVVVATPQAVAGREFDVVVVAGIQDGVWPNTRLRGSVLGSTALVDVVAGRAVGRSGHDAAGLRAARTEVLHDELRMLYVAVTRARRRLLVTAVSNADTVPSAFVDLLDPLDDAAPRPVVSAPRSVSLSGVVARLRCLVLDEQVGDAVRRQAAAQLARLSAEAVPGANPREWYGWAGLSDTAALAGSRPVRVSPSAIEQFDECPLRWLLDRSGARPPAPASVGVGTLVHDLADAHPDASADHLIDELDRRWPELGLQPGWVSDQLQARAQAMLERLVNYRRRLQGEVVAREEPFALPVGDAVLTGRVDQLERDSQGRLVAVDLKTGRSAPTSEAARRHPQLGAYQLAVEAGAFDRLAPGAGSGGARLVQLGNERKTGVKVQDQGPVADDADPQWAHDLVGRVAAGMAGREFAAVVNPGCRHCPVRSSCPAQGEGRQVGE